MRFRLCDGFLTNSQKEDCRRTCTAKIYLVVLQVADFLNHRTIIGFATISFRNPAASQVGSVCHPIFTSMRTFYVDKNGTRQGPFTLDQLRKMWNSGIVSGKHLYCEEGGTRWSKLAMMQSVLESNAPQSNQRPDASASFLKEFFWAPIEKLRNLFK